MLIRRIYDDGLAQASYLLGCDATREAIVIDPNRDVRQYIEAAREAALRIVAVTETHIHADFVSGARELAELTGARLMLSGEGGDGWRYTYATDATARFLRDGDTITVGKVRLDVMHTPGHTPEHVTFLVTDTATAAALIGAFTGDFLFVGEVGRPDLLERAAGVQGSMESGARDLRRSLDRFSALPAHLQIWPGHGAGSACGKSLGAMPQSTLGYERIANWALAPQSEAEFVAHVLAGQPDPPAYFARMKYLNRDGPPAVASLASPRRLGDAALDEVAKSGARVIDTRATSRFAERHVPGTINIPFNKSFATWAGWLVPPGEPFYLIADDTGAEGAVRALRLIGLDSVAGTFDARAVDGAAPSESVSEIGIDELAARIARGDASVIDVRAQSEWDAGHIAGATHIPLGRLSQRINEVPRDGTIVLQCQGGSRSMIATSVLLAHGRAGAINLVGGFGEWERSGRPVARGGSAHGAAHEAAQPERPE